MENTHWVNQYLNVKCPNCGCEHHIHAIREVWTCPDCDKTLTVKKTTIG